MAGYEVVPSPGYPSPNYQAFGSELGNLFGTFQNSQQNQNALEQQKRKQQQQDAVKTVAPFLANGQPNYAGQIAALMGAGDTGAMGSLGPLATEAQGGTVSGLFSGAQTPAPGPGVGPNGPPAPAQPTGDVPPASAANSSATRPQTAAPNQGPFGNISGTATSGTTIADMTGKAIPDPDKSKMVAGLIARGVGADPTSPLTPDQAARVQKALASYSQRNPGVASWQDVQRDNAQGTANLPRVAAEGAAAGGAGGGTDNLVGQIKKGIAGVESGGKYDAVGPVTASGDRAYGKYQVMGENVGPWTQQALGYAMTPEQFLKNQGAQEAVASTKIQELLAKGNSPQDVASEWLTGKPLAQGANLRDQNGTSGAQYASAVTRGIPGGGQPIVDAVPLPRGYTEPQKAIMAVDQEIARFAASPNPGERRQIPALEDYRDRLVKSREPQKLSPTETILGPGGEVRAQGAFAGSQGMMTPEAIDGAAENWIKSGELPKNMGRGVQGAQAMNTIMNRAYQIMEEQGIDPSSRTTAWQDFRARGIGESAGARTEATREKSLELILRAADAAIPAALEQSEKVSRTGWVPLNQIIQKGEVIASDPELKTFGMANLQLAEHWARAMNPMGVMREGDRDLALHFLSTADSKETYRRAVMQLKTQIEREFSAVKAGKEGGDGADALRGADATSAPAPKGGSSGEPAKVSSKAEYDALPKGKQYVAPDGSVRVKQ